MLRIIALIALLAGCAARTGPAHEATLYVYRPHSTLYAEGYPYVLVDGARTVALRNDTHAVLPLTPGFRQIRIDGTPWATNWPPLLVSRQLIVEAGKEYFLRVMPELPAGGDPARAGVARVDSPDKEQALREMAGTRRIAK